LDTVKLKVTVMVFGHGDQVTSVWVTWGDHVIRCDEEGEKT